MVGTFIFKHYLMSIYYALETSLDSREELYNEIECPILLEFALYWGGVGGQRLEVGEAEDKQK